VIWAPTFDETIGGAIALHALCDRLHALGVEARVWPELKPLVRLGDSPRRMWRWLRYAWSGGDRDYSPGPFSNRLARNADVKDAVVVYPEIVSGNPLRSERVVRWFLHKPGFHTGEIHYGPNDLCFCYNTAFNDASLNPAGNCLRVSYLDPVYHQWNFGDRSGSAFLIRKGRGRPLDAHPADAICVDGLDHNECAEVFNRVERLYSYDSYSYYSVFAALCGCTPIVIPEAGVSEAAWEPDHERRLGIAYGEARVGWAEATREALRESVARSRAVEDRTVLAFMETCRARFGTSE
jgi:hypothetical protein